MSQQQCNSCGGFHNVTNCSDCHVLVCDKCILNHEAACKYNQARKRRGEGPTIRNTVSVISQNHAVVAPLSRGEENQRQISSPSVLGAPYEGYAASVTADPLELKFPEGQNPFEFVDPNVQVTATVSAPEEEHVPTDEAAGIGRFELQESSENPNPEVTEA